MSGYRERKDRLSRELGAADRRPRAELTYRDTFGVASTVALSTDVGACPNIGPSNAGNEICTIQSTAEVAGTPYNIVNLSDVSVVPGADVLSYCFEGKVGPGTGPILITCNGEWGLLEDGLIYREGFNYPGGWLDTDLSDFGGAVGDWHLETPPLDSITRLFGNPAGLYDDAELEGLGWSTYHNEAAFQFRVQTPSSRTVAGQRDLVGGMGVNFDVAGGPFPTDMYWGGRAELLGAASYVYIGKLNAATHDVVFASIQENSAPTWWMNMSTGKKGLLQHLRGSTTNPASSDTQWMAGGILNSAQTGLPGGGQDAVHSTRHGRLCFYASKHFDYYAGIVRSGLWFWDIKVTKNAVVEVRGAASTDYWLRYAHRDYASTGGYLPTLIRARPTDYKLGIDGEYYDWPFRAFEVWTSTNASDPTSTGTLVLEECAPSRGIWPGDVWTFSSAGDLSSTQLFAGDAQATVQLEFLDASSGVISTYEPTGAQSEAYSRVGTAYLGAPVPYNANRMRFTPYKRGTADAFACVRQLQVNTGSVECCVYGAPTVGGVNGVVDYVAIAGLHYVDLDGDLYSEPYVKQIWDSINSTLVPGSAITVSYDEHRTGSQNLVDLDGYDIHSGPGVGSSGAASTGRGYEYGAIELFNYDLSSGDLFSVRFQARLTT